MLLLAGCATTPPKTVEIRNSTELREVESKLARFLGQSCVNAIDCDVQLSWKAYGHGKTFSATMQAMHPSSLRLAMIDPLGRPLILLGAHGNRFTLADNNEAIGYTGTMDLDVVQKFLPEFIPKDDIFYWLSGRINKRGLKTLSTRMDAEENLTWYEVAYPSQPAEEKEKTTHMLALNAENQLARHMVLDADGDVQFEAKYSAYSATPTMCSWPGQVEISGDALDADFTLVFTEIFDFNPMKKKRFHVKIPPHFEVRKLINES
jgi:outer membrane biogenesis lipoprotein LolB